MQRLARVISYLVAILVCLALLSPLYSLFASWSVNQSGVWGHLWATSLPRLLTNTAILSVGVGLLVLLIGGSLAWLTSQCDFPGRGFFDWALILPLAMPTYVLAFVFLGLLDFTGPLQTALRDWGIIETPWSVRGPVTVVIVMSLVLYPYVYLLAKGVFSAHGRSLLEASRSLGLTPWQGVRQVVLPMARPALATGVALAVMEVLADFGAVAVFNFDTFTTAIYKSWFDLFAFQAAAQLATLLLLFVAIALLTEANLRRRISQLTSKRGDFRRYQLHSWQAYAASFSCALVLLLAFILPSSQLLFWLWSEQGAIDARFFSWLENTLLLATLAVAFIVVLALLLAFMQRAYHALRPLVALSTLGYALPGSVLAVGLMGVFAWLDRVNQDYSWGLPILLGSVTALVFAYGVRFLRVAYSPIVVAVNNISPSLSEVARLLGYSAGQTTRRVWLPMVRPALLTAALLVFVEVMKEMPATLLMRPFGWDTLAVQIYNFTSEGQWQQAALPALSLVMAGLIPVLLLIRQGRS